MPREPHQPRTRDTEEGAQTHSRSAPVSATAASGVETLDWASVPSPDRALALVSHAAEDQRATSRCVRAFTGHETQARLRFVLLEVTFDIGEGVHQK